MTARPEFDYRAWPFLLRFYLWAGVATGVLSLLARNPTPFVGCLISGLLFVPFVWWLDEWTGTNERHRRRTSPRSPS